MPICQLTDKIVFPDPEMAEENGLLAIGGDLSVKRLLVAYSRGIFPWYSGGEPPLWWFTNPRLVLFPQEFHIPRRLARTLRNADFEITFDTNFKSVIKACADIRVQKGERTWISREMQDAYIEFHHAGYAHSVECWLHGDLVGGLYGVKIDNIFFGESMFTKTSNASQAALVALVDHVQKIGVAAIDCQMTTVHLLRFGAREISGSGFRQLLQENINEMNYK